MHKGLRLAKSQTEPITSSLVERFANMLPSIVERPLNENRLDYLKDRLLDGLAIPFIWSYVTYKGKDYRMNGQHSSKMLASMNGNMPQGLVAHIDQFEVESEEEMVAIFRQYDARVSGRSPLDVANAYASVVPGLQGIQRDVLKIAAEGINWVNSNIERLPPSKADDRYAALMEGRNLTFLQWIATVFSMKTPEMKQQPVVGAMYKTFFIDPEQAAKFWASVARGGDEYNDTNPERQLDVWLRRTKDKTDVLKCSPTQIYQACVIAWNAFVDGKQLKTIGKDQLDVATKGIADAKYPA